MGVVSKLLTAATGFAYLAPSVVSVNTNRENAVYNNYQYPTAVANLDLFPGCVKFSFKPTTVAHGENAAAVQTILLFMPDDIVIGNNLEYETFNPLQAGVDVGSQANTIYSGEKITPTKKSWEKAGRYAAAVSNSVGGLFGAAGIGFALGTALPQFKDVSFRELQLHFVFVAYSKEDSVTIANIVKSFRIHSLPDGYFDSDSLANANLTGPPDLVDITFMFNGEQNKFLPKFKTAYITSVDVDYFGHDGIAMHVDGAPVYTKLTITIKEKYKILRADVLGGY